MVINNLLLMPINLKHGISLFYQVFTYSLLLIYLLNLV